MNAQYGNFLDCSNCAAASVIVSKPTPIIDFMKCCFSRLDSDQDDSLYTFVKMQIRFICLLQPYVLVKNSQVIYPWRLQICCKVDKFQSSSSEAILCCFFPKVTANDCLV